jgi:hypothetical protein
VASGYSAQTVSIGSIVAARRAGKYVASAAAKIVTAPAAT